MPIVYVAMSGGVDSSVAAALLKKRGFEVVGVFMKPWQPPSDSFCLWKQDREDAMRVAAVLGIPLLTWDFSRDYYKTVTKYMIDSYKKGNTPNPDVMCNKEIKFGLFLKKALKYGADYIATGHYVRKDKRIGIYDLLKAKDKNKDQSYFLWTLTQEQLKYCLFPIGDYVKPEVRILAKKFRLPNWDKKDSQGVCFVGNLDMKEFLKGYLRPRQGMVKNIKNEIIGEHEGAQYYTIGQRHGYKILKSGGPYFVVKKDNKNNILYVDKKNKKSYIIKVSNVSWVNSKPKIKEAKIQTRYRTPMQEGKITLLKNNQAKISLKTEQTSITPGQSVVFFQGSRLIGGGIIK
ncbi:MAG: tRNA 2-thiouridine(34) synthase MnmA [Candidatus Yanofskybacteria bacterium]|nr:tRNA 2-thiouridine(34) synthase MnmA [Candidatus Yanofskybacteria bacterium]